MATDAHAPSAQEVVASRVFDHAWYLARNPDVAAAGLDPLAHFIAYGRDEQRWPNRYFDPAWYRIANPDVAATAVDPLLHYVRYGEKEGRRPHPVFEPNWYRTAYSVPNDRNALGHFITHRLTAPVAPSPDLFAVRFIAPYRDDPANGVDPIAHYLDDAERLGSNSFPDADVVRAAGLMDDTYYLLNAPDVRESDVDTVGHYCRYGWRERRKPNLYFDPDWYVQTNPDLRRLQVNPLVHYILLGENAGSWPSPCFNPGWYRSRHDVPTGHGALAHYLTHRRSQSVSPNPLFDVAWYLERFGSVIGPNRDPFAHYLHAGTARDIDPCPTFNAAAYRKQHMGRPSRMFGRALEPDRHNPLVHFLRAQHARPESAQQARPGTVATPSNGPLEC